MGTFFDPHDATARESPGALPLEIRRSVYFEIADEGSGGSITFSIETIVDKPL